MSKENCIVLIVILVFVFIMLITTLTMENPYRKIMDTLVVSDEVVSLGSKKGHHNSLGTLMVWLEDLHLINLTTF